MREPDKVGLDTHKKILVVEDNTGVSEVLCELMEIFGFKPQAIAKNYEEAVQLFDLHKPDLVTLDIHLEGDKTGVEVAEYIRQKSSTPFIFISSAIDDVTMNRAKSSKPYAHLIKPIDAQMLEDTLKSIFAY